MTTLVILQSTYAKVFTNVVKDRKTYLNLCKPRCWSLGRFALVFNFFVGFEVSIYPVMDLNNILWPRRFDLRQRCDNLFVRQDTILDRHSEFIVIVDHCFKTILGKIEEHFSRVVPSMSRLVVGRR